jgi:hypothetical protein
MKAILEFDLDDPDDRMAHLRCVKATDMAIMLFDFFHNDCKGFDEEVGEKFASRLNENNINIEELIR